MWIAKCAWWGNPNSESDPPLQSRVRMLIKLLKSKIHNATVTLTDVNYHREHHDLTRICCACGLLPNEAVIVADSGGREPV